MNPLAKTFWYIERHLASEIVLDDVAAAAGLSRFYLSRMFTAATGRPLMAFVRGRRLSEAARALADGAPDILSVALEAGYGSHEAFTRAFGDQFGITPEQVRAQGSLAGLTLVEALRMDQMPRADLAPPTFVTGPAKLLAGFSERYSCDNKAGIPMQWRKFTPHIGSMPGQVGADAYGVVANADESGNMDYLVAVEVASFDDLPAEFTRLRLPVQRYAVFQHREHVSTIANTFAAIWSLWMPSSGHEATDAPVIERYTPQFDGETGMGGIEIWIPIQG